MNLSRFFGIGSFIVAGFIAPFSMAQEQVQIARPADGEMVALNASNMWKISQLSDVQISEIQKITTNAKFPSIAPDGNKILLFEPSGDDSPRKLLQWTPQNATPQEIMRGQNVSRYMTWDDASHISMRQADKPFFHDAHFLKLRLDKKSATLRSKKRLSESGYFTYDSDDIIILVRRDTETLQAISDTNADRYYAPMLSPDEKYVVFSGLTTGVHLFDIAKNAVVYIGTNGTEPGFSPDGRYLIYAETTDDGNDYLSGNLVIVDLKKHARRTISNPSKEIRLRGTLSSDASFVAYETAQGEVFRAQLSGLE